jgi:hypothetical protein
MKINRIILVCLLVAGFLVSGFSQAADNAVTIKKLELNIWPEYDQPQTLVIFRITLSSDTHLPAQISLRIPRAAGSPYSVAIKDLDGLVYDVEYTLIPEGEWNRIVLTTPSAEIQVEYYDPDLTIDGTLHSLSYRWIGDYPINDLTVVVQQPRGAYNVNINPYLGVGKINPDDDLVYYTASLGKLDTGIAFDLSLNYQKADDSLSATSISVKPAGQFPLSNTLANQVQSILLSILHDQGLWITAFLLLAWLVLFLLALWLAGAHLFDHWKRQPRPVEESKNGQTAPPRYCSQCGKKAVPGDIYCRVCGTKLPLP